MQNKLVTTDYFDYEDMYNRLEMLNNLAKIPSKIKVSFDFYKKIQNNIETVNYKKFEERFWSLPLEVDLNQEEDYRFIYKEDENAN